jgi:hypothetical protein
MGTNRIIQALDAEIDRLEQTRVLLVGRTAPTRRAKSVSAKPTARFKPLRSKARAEGQARIAGPQRAKPD